MAKASTNKIDIYGDYKLTGTTHKNNERDSFGMIYDSMLRSNAYKNLTLREKHFYTICRVYARTEKANQIKYNFQKECRKFNPKITFEDIDFCFPETQLKRYGIDKSNASKMFDSLEKNGFIVRKMKNKDRQKMNVYSFSNNWKQQEFKQTPKDK